MDFHFWQQTDSATILPKLESYVKIVESFRGKDFKNIDIC